MSFIKQIPIKAGPIGCPCCGYQYEVLPMDAVLAVGFGSTTVEKNDKSVYDECDVKNDNYWTAQDAEELATPTPD